MRAMHDCSYHEIIWVLNSLVLVLNLTIWYRFTVPFSETYKLIFKKPKRILFRQEKTVSDVLH